MGRSFGFFDGWRPVLSRWSPGDVLPGESFTRVGTTAWYFDVNGILQPTVANQKRDLAFVGGVQSFLHEPAATNIVLLPRDLTNGAWVHTTMTPAKDQVGIDGVAASASSILATGANATSLQTVVLASSTRSQQAWVKRLIGAGVVSMTMDNVTFTPIAVTGAWTKVTIPSQAALVNPVIGFKLATSGDKIAVDFVDNESGLFNTSPKIGTRNADLYTFPFFAPPTGMTVWCKAIDLGGMQQPAGNPSLWTIGSSPQFDAFMSAAGSLATRQLNGSSVTSVSTAIALNDSVEARSVIRDDGAVTAGISRNGAAEVVSATSGVLALPGAWGSLLVHLGTNSAGGGATLAAFQGFKVLQGTRTMLDARAA